MNLPRVLFFIPNLPRRIIQLGAITEGHEALSGSHTSFLLISDGLARRGHPVGVVVQDGGRIAESKALVFATLEQGVRWSGKGGKVIWCSWGDADSLMLLRAVGLQPWMWLHTDVESRFLRWLERREIASIITVSDLARMTSLHSSQYQRIGRVYNPLNPFFARVPVRSSTAYASQQLVFAAYIGESKGAHRVLEMWLHVRAELPNARLVLAGSGQLYGERRNLGSFGVAAPDFEARFLYPLAKRFGSLEAAGIQTPGLLAPSALRELYKKSALGIVNLNWDESTETFCCSAVEMLASALPVVSVARGSLPETIGFSHGAFLMTSPNLLATANEVVRLLRDPERLEVEGQVGRRYVCVRYTLGSILDNWEQLLTGTEQDLFMLSGNFAFKRSLRYWVEIMSGRLRVGRGLEACLACASAVRRLAKQWH